MSAQDIILFESEAAFSALVQAHSADLLALAIKITRSKQVAEDIVQEAFLKLWQKRDEIIPQNLGGWLYKVVSNLAYKHLKKESRQLRVVNLLGHVKAPDGNSVDELLINKENKAILHDIFSRLPEKQLAVYHLSREKGMRRNEIADQLNLSPNTVKVHLYRALQFIREHFVSISVFLLLFVFHNFIFRNSNTNTAQEDLYNIKQLISRDLPEKKVIRISSKEPMRYTGIYR